MVVRALHGCSQFIHETVGRRESLEVVVARGNNLVETQVLGIERTSIAENRLLYQIDQNRDGCIESAYIAGFCAES